MATQNIELILKILASGEQDVAALAASIEKTTKAIKAMPEKLPASASFKSLTDEVKFFASRVEQLTPSFDAFTKELKEFENKGAETFNLLTQKGKIFVDLLTKTGNTKLDFDVTKPTKELLAAEKAAKALDDRLERLRQNSVEQFSVIAERINLVKQRLRELGGNQLALKVNTENVDRLAQQLGIVASRVRPLPAAFNSAEKSFRDFASTAQNVEGRTKTLGQTVSATASEALFLRRVFFGLGFAALSNQVLTTVVAFDKLRAQFSAVFQERAGIELAFITKEADRLGVSVTNLGDQYAKFTAAVKGTNIEGEKAKNVFLATAEAASRLSLSQDDLNGALTAIQQIASKGRLSLEELRQQLGDRLPGAVRIASESLGITQQKLFALIEAGKIDSETFLSGFGEALRKNFGTDANTRIETLAASIQRVKDAFASLIDTVTKGDGQTAIRKIADSLVKFANDPAVISGIQNVIKAFAALTTFVIDNGGAILNLIKAYVAFKIALIALSGIQGISVLFAGATSKIIENGAAATATAAKLGGLQIILSRFALGLGVVVAAYQATSAAAEFFAERTIKAQEAANKFQNAFNALRSASAQITGLESLGVTLDTISLALVKNGVELKKLSETELVAYINGVNAVKVAISDQDKLVKANIESTKAQIAIIEGTKNATREQANELAFLRSKLIDLTETQEKVKVSSLEIATAFNEATARLKVFRIDIAALDTVTFQNLTKEQQGIVKNFEQIISQGESVREAIDKSVPKEFALGTVKGIVDTIQAFKSLANEGKISGDILRDSLIKELEKLSGNELNKFQVNAEFAFKTSQIGAQGFAEVLKVSASAGLKQLGIDAELAGSKISSSFVNSISIFTALGNNAQATGKQINEAFKQLTDTGDSLAELELLRAKFDELGLSAKTFSDEFTDNLARLEDKTRLLSGVLDNSLGDSFERLGIKARSELSSLANQAQIDFERIKSSGQANLEELKTAFAKFAAEATRANNNIVPIQVKIQALNLDAFDVIVRSAETASDRVKKSFDSALASADTLAKLEALKAAIENTFESGRISVEDYGKALSDINSKIFDLTQQTAGELAGALSRLGVQTREQLGGAANQLAADFDQLKNAGVLTTNELEAAFKKYAEAAIKANNGVASSFIEAQASSLGFESVLASITQRANEFKATLEKIQAITITASGPADLPTEELLRSLSDFPLRGGGFVDPKLIENFVVELARRGVSAPRNFEAFFAKEIQAALEKDAKQNNTFNFNQPNVTVDGVKNNIIPALERVTRRRG
jgi:tape measure domain-containing protein